MFSIDRWTRLSESYVEQEHDKVPQLEAEPLPSGGGRRESVSFRQDDLDSMLIPVLSPRMSVENSNMSKIVLIIKINLNSDSSII